jgi:type I restriction enzyme S subunit
MSLIEQPSFLNRVRRYEQGTVYERQAVHPTDFIKAIVELPSLPEQQKIADFLTTLSNRIAAVEQKIGQMEAFKKGLLQQMFV